MSADSRSADSRSGFRRAASLRVIAAFLSCALLVAACGDDDTTASPSDTADGGETADGTTGDSAAASSIECETEAAGDPAKVGYGYPDAGAISIPELGISAAGSVEYANACLGGIAGRPIDLVTCKIDETNPASATECANGWVEDGVNVVILAGTASGDTIVPIVTGAGIPYVTSSAASPAEFVSDTGLVFSLTGGLAASFGAMAQDAKAEGISKVALVVSEDAAATVGGLAGIPFGAADVELQVVSAPAGTADLTPQIQGALSSGAGATAFVGDGTLCISYLNALAAIDPDGRHYIIVTCTGEDVVEAVGEQGLDGAILATGQDAVSDDPEAVLYRGVMAEYADLDDIFGFAVTAYSTVISVIRATADIQGEVTPETVAEALRTEQDVPIAAGGGTVFTCDGTANPILTTACSSEVLLTTMDGTSQTDFELVDSAALYGV